MTSEYGHDGGVAVPTIPVRPARRRRGWRARRRDRFAAAILKRADGTCDNCGARHGDSHGPLIACAHGIAACRECQERLGIKPYGPGPART